MLAASPIESARLCHFPALGNLGNSSGQVGRNLMFHFQTNVNGFLPERVHGQRGRAVTHGISDFRGVEPGGDTIRVIRDADGPHVYMGGICEFGASQGLPITEDGNVYAFQLPGSLGRRFGVGLKNALRDEALGQHLFGPTMQAEDAPQLSNMVDLDPSVRDVFGHPFTGILRPARLRAGVPHVLPAVPAPDRSERRGAPAADFIAPCDATLGNPPSAGM